MLYILYNVSQTFNNDHWAVFILQTVTHEYNSLILKHIYNTKIMELNTYLLKWRMWRDRIYLLFV